MPARLDGTFPSAGADHERHATDQLVVLRGRHRPDRGRPRRRLRQGRLRDLARRRLQPRRDQPAGVIYRVDPATGKSSVFFDLNTVIGAISPGATAANSSGDETGFVNWYDLAFDPEGYFDGRPSLFISTADATDPNKNAVSGSARTVRSSARSPSSPSARNLHVRLQPDLGPRPPPEQQSFLRGPSVGGTNTGGLFFSATGYRPGQTIPGGSPPTGVSNAVLVSRHGRTGGPGDRLRAGTVAASTDFGTFDPFTGTGSPGSSGITLSFISTPPGTAAPIPPDLSPFIDTRFRRFQDVAFDQYGYFSNGLPIDAGGLPAPPAVFAGSIFVADLGTGVNFRPRRLPPNDPTFPVTPIRTPSRRAGRSRWSATSSGRSSRSSTVKGTSTGGFGVGGRIIRIDRNDPDGNGSVTDFARGFNTSNIQGPQSFVDSSLSITFSADGTTLYASDNDGIWQFKTVGSLANCRPAR